MPLQADSPKTFGVAEFCQVCLKCAEACPARAISKEREPGYTSVSPSNNPGVKKWYNHVENCFKYWTVKVDCSACIASCPYNKLNTWTHRLGLRLSQTPAKSFLRWLDDQLGYGKTFDTAALLDFWAGPDGKPIALKAGSEHTPDRDAHEPGEEVSLSTPLDFFAELSDRLKRHPEKIAGVEAVYLFRLTGENGGRWYVRLHSGSAEVGEGEAPDANCTLTIRDTDFLALVSGKLKAPLALISGKLAVSGDMSLAVKTPRILGE
jgi:ferredoxin